MTGTMDKKYSFSLFSVAIAHLVILFVLKFSLLPTPYKMEADKKTVINLKLKDIINVNLGTISSNKRGSYLRHSDSKKSTELKQRSYKKVLEQLNKYDLVETDPSSKELKLSDLDLKDFDPEAIKRKVDIKALKLTGKEIERFLKDNKARRVRYQQFTPTLNNSQVSVQMEIPKGLKIEKVDQIQNVFYSFQRRISLAYVNSFYNKLSDFEFKNPHLTFPMTNKEITLQAVATFDLDGNLQKIKMVRWTDRDQLQDFFVNVLDGIQSIPNPPKDIVKEKETFRVFYTLKLN